MYVTKEEWKSVVLELSELFRYQYLKDLLLAKYEVYGDTMDKYVGAKAKHHNYIGGLKQHTFEMLKSFLALYKTDLYSDIVPDYVVLAVLYHDLAKVYEYSAKQFDNGYVQIEYTPYISLIGHLYGSARILEKDLDTVPECNTEQKMQILHCVLAHHGLKEWDAIKEPQTKEAQMVHQLDMLSSKCSTLKTAQQSQK